MKGLSIISIILLFIGLSASLYSCKGKQTNELTEEELLAEAARRDSAALHVAIYPSEACIPFYYAEATGIYDSMDVDIRFSHLNAMEDCDTALYNHHVEVASTDIARLINMQKNGQLFNAIATMNGQLRLFSARGKKISDIKQLKERIVALERHSESDYWSDELSEKRELEQLDIFRTQFNQHSIRYDMLNGETVDAAFLDEPWATLAENNGSVSMWKRDEKMLPWTVLAANDEAQSDTNRIEQVKKLIIGYNLAVQFLNKGEQKEKYDSILIYTYNVSNLALDSIEGLKPSAIGFKPLSSTPDSLVNVAKQWLIKRNWISEQQNTNQIIKDKFIPKR